MVSTLAPTPALAVVDAPQVVPPTVGLVAALSGTPFLIDNDTGERTSYTDQAQRWQGGYRYAPEQTCWEGAVDDPCSQVVPMINPGNPAMVEAIPFVTWGGDSCSTIGWQSRDYEGRARRALLAVESKQIAKEFWKGTQAQASAWPNLYLASGAHVQILSSVAQAPGDALAFLEQGIADAGNGQRGMIHCTRQFMMKISELGNTFRSVNNLVLTYADTIIVADAGYDGSGPAAQPAAATQWAYATLIPTIRRGGINPVPESLPEAVFKGINKVEFFAWRLASVSVPDCVLVACEIAMPAPVGGAS